MTAPDHTTRAAELLTNARPETRSPSIRVHAGIGYALLALADALAGRVQRPRWDDDLRADAATGSGPGLEVAPDAPSPVAGDLRRVIGERDRLREGIRATLHRYANEDGGIEPEDGWRLVSDLLALLADDPTHRGPITVGGKTRGREPLSGTCAMGLCESCTRGPTTRLPCAHACHRAPKEGQG